MWKVKVKPDRFNKTYSDKDVKEGQLCQIIDKCNERKTYKCKLFWNTFKKIHLLYAGDERIFKILFANDNMK